jgi:hypothetical protein
VAFVTSSFIVYFIAISIVNDTALMNVELTPGKSIFWWLGLLSTIWVVSRNVLKEQPIFFPEKKMGKLAKFLHYVPDDVAHRANTAESVSWLKRSFQYRTVQLLTEMVSIFVNPFVLWFCLGTEQSIVEVVDFIRDSTIEHSKLGKVCEYSVFDIPESGTDTQHLVMSLLDQKLGGGSAVMEPSAPPAESSVSDDGKMVRSVELYYTVADDDVDGLVDVQGTRGKAVDKAKAKPKKGVGTNIGSNVESSDNLINEMDDNADMFRNGNANTLLDIISPHKPK